MRYIKKWLSRIALYILFFTSILANLYGKNLGYSREKYGSFTPEDSYSYDGKLLAHQQIEKGIGVNDLTKRIFIEIRDSKTGALLARFSPARAWDFWGICWENDNYNIWIQSADVGIHCYRYENEHWMYDDSHPVPPDYIVSKYDEYRR